MVHKVRNTNLWGLFNPLLLLPRKNQTVPMVAKVRNTNLWDLFNPLLGWAVAQEEPNCPHGRQGQECEQQEAQYQTAQTVILCKKNTVSLR